MTAGQSGLGIALKAAGNKLYNNNSFDPIKLLQQYGMQGQPQQGASSGGLGSTLASMGKTAGTAAAGAAATWAVGALL